MTSQYDYVPKPSSGFPLMLLHGLTLHETIDPSDSERFANAMRAANRAGRYDGRAVIARSVLGQGGGDISLNLWKVGAVGRGRDRKTVYVAQDSSVTGAPYGADNADGFADDADGFGGVVALYTSNVFDRVTNRMVGGVNARFGPKHARQFNWFAARQWRDARYPYNYTTGSARSAKEAMQAIREVSRGIATDLEARSYPINMRSWLVVDAHGRELGSVRAPGTPDVPGFHGNARFSVFVIADGGNNALGNAPTLKTAVRMVEQGAAGRYRAWDSARVRGTGGESKVFDAYITREEAATHFPRGAFLIPRSPYGFGADERTPEEAEAEARRSEAKAKRIQRGVKETAKTSVDVAQSIRDFFNVLVHGKKEKRAMENQEFGNEVRKGVRAKFFHPATMGVMLPGTVERVDGERVLVRFERPARVKGRDRYLFWTSADNIELGAKPPAGGLPPKNLSPKKWVFVLTKKKVTAPNGKKATVAKLLKAPTTVRTGNKKKDRRIANRDFVLFVRANPHPYLGHAFVRIGKRYAVADVWGVPDAKGRPIRIIQVIKWLSAGAGNVVINEYDESAYPTDEAAEAEAAESQNESGTTDDELQQAEADFEEFGANAPTVDPALRIYRVEGEQAMLRGGPGDSRQAMLIDAIGERGAYVGERRLYHPDRKCYESFRVWRIMRNVGTKDQRAIFYAQANV